MVPRIQAASLSIFIGLCLCSCTHRNNERVGEGARKAEQASQKAAKELGKASYKVAQAAGKVAKKAGEQLKSASKDAHQGWEEEKRKEKAKSEDR